MPVAVLGIPALATYSILKVYLNHKLRNRMIDKGFVDDASQAIFKGEHENLAKYSSLKWGLIILFGGIGLTALEFIDYSYNSPFPFGFVAVCVALGFLIYFAIVKREIDKSNRE